MITAGLAENSPRQTNFQLVMRMACFIGHVRRTALAACTLVALWVCIDVSAIWLTGNILTGVQESLTAGKLVPPGVSLWVALGQPPLLGIVQMVLMLGVLVLLGALVRYGREYTNAKFSMDIVYPMRAGIYDRLQRVGFAFHDEHSSGALINRAFSDLQNVRAFLQVGLIVSVEIVAFVIGMNILILSVSRWMALLALVPVPFWVWYILRFSKKIQPVQAEYMKAGDELVTVVTENVSGVNVVRAFATEGTEISKYNASADRYFDKVMAAVRLWRNFVPVIRGIASASQLANDA